MKLKFKCKECGGTGDIATPPSSPYDYVGWTHRTCDVCQGHGFIEVDQEDEVK